MGENLSYGRNAKLSIRGFFSLFYHKFLPEVGERERSQPIQNCHLLPPLLAHTSHVQLGRSEGGRNRWRDSSAPELYQDTFPVLPLKKFSEVTAKQSCSNASAARLREEPGCQKSWMWGSASSPNAAMKGALRTKAARTIKTLLPCPLYSFTSFISPTDSPLQN